MPLKGAFIVLFQLSRDLFLQTMLHIARGRRMATAPFHHQAPPPPPLNPPPLNPPPPKEGVIGPRPEPEEAWV